jgi:hypothetical protein
VEEQTHVERLPDRAETRHQPMIEASEMFVLEGRDDQVGQCDRAGLYRIAGELPVLKKNFRKDIERVLDVAAITLKCAVMNV